MPQSVAVNIDSNQTSWPQNFVVWFFEVSLAAIATCAILVALAFVHSTPGDVNDVSLRPVVGITLMVFIQFGMTGYLVTTGIIGTFFRFKRYFPYPLAVGVLYFIHSTIFFLAVGNHFFDKQNLIIQISGTFSAFLCALAGNQLLRRWRRSNLSPRT
jgi:hypothetical protein